MTYNRMEAKPIDGEHCRFCGDAKAPLVKTPCCQQWICCDTAFFSFRGGGRCQVEHERFSLCYSHYEDRHGGPWSWRGRVTPPMSRITPFSGSFGSLKSA